MPKNLINYPSTSNIYVNNSGDDLIFPNGQVMASGKTYTETRGVTSELVTNSGTGIETDPIFIAQKGQANGVAGLGPDGKVPSSQLPTASNAVTSVNSQTGVVVLAKADVGLSNVDNTNDINKPISIAQAIVNNLRLNKAGDTITGDIASTATGFFQIASGTTAQRPANPVVGMRRFNTDTGRDEFYAGGTWQNHARLGIDANKSVNISRANATTGVAPTTGEIATPVNGDIANVRLNDKTIESWSYTTVWALAFSARFDAPNITATPITGSGSTVALNTATVAGQLGELASQLKTVAGGAGIPANLGLGAVTSTSQVVTNSNGTGVTLPAATTTSAGLISSSDKTKLDGLSNSTAGKYNISYGGTSANTAGDQLTTREGMSIPVTISTTNLPVLFLESGTSPATPTTVKIKSSTTEYVTVTLPASSLAGVYTCSITTAVINASTTAPIVTYLSNSQALPGCVFSIITTNLS